jgi:hypothetical protein
MKSLFVLALAAGTIAAAAPVWAHDTPNLEHSHAFQQTGYGTWRQGHYVNGPQGSIIIWSPQPYTEYQNRPAVRFARPKPITKAPAGPAIRPGAGLNPAPGYGKNPGRDRAN